VRERPIRQGGSGEDALCRRGDGGAAERVGMVTFFNGSQSPVSSSGFGGEVGGKGGESRPKFREKR
jgi:hypothetical protein